MPRAFWLGWAIAVTLAVVVPVAVPYAIWPPREGAHDDLVAECGRRAENNAVQASHPIASTWPLSNDVHVCFRDEAGVLVYTAGVTARGPYGIPIATAEVGRRNISWTTSEGGQALAALVLLGGVAAVSAPFAFVLLQRRLRSAVRPSFA